MRLLHYGLLALTLASYLPLWIHPDHLWIISTLGLLSPSLWFLTLLFAAYWLLKGDKVAIWSGITLLLGWSMINNAFALPDDGYEASQQDLTVVSLNGHGFALSSKAGKEDVYARIAAHLDSLDADVLCLQEYFVAKKGREMAAFLQKKTDLKYEFSDPDGRLAVFSRYPLSNGKVSYFTNKVNGYLEVDVQSPAGAVHLCNIHLQTNAISHMAHAVAQDPDIREKNTWKKIKRMFARYRRANKSRTEQSAQILASLAQSKLPTIVCGDFNEVPTSYLYRNFRTQFQDAHLVQGWGLGTTYGGLIPALRIDYILPQKGIRVIDFERKDCWFSDHDAVWARLRL